LTTAKNLAEQQQLLETLLEPYSLSDPLEPDSALPIGFRKTVRVIGHLRRRAATVPGSNLEEYHLGLLFQGARRLQAFREGRRYPHQKLTGGLSALLSTGLIGQWLEGPSTPTPPSLPEQAKTGLWMDEASRSVWVEGRQVSLSRMLYELLLLLYRREGQVCNRATIAREVFKVEFFDPLIEETRINPLIGRLRKRVEPDPSRPRYIITHHGVGYVLHARAQKEKK
jgi:DNA-binding response OmpR family regulator